MLMPSIPPFTTPIVIAFLGHQASGSDLTTYSLASQPLTTSGFNVAVFAARSGGSISLSSCTIDGVAATCTTMVTGGTCIAIAVAAATTNATGTVSPTFSGGAARCAVATYSMVGAASATPGTTSSDTTDPFTHSLTCAEGSVVFAGAAVVDTTSFSSTNLTEDADSQTNYETNTYSFASGAFAAAQSSLTLTVDPGAFTAGAGGFAVFSP